MWKRMIVFVCFYYTVEASAQVPEVLDLEVRFRTFERFVSIRAREAGISAPHVFAKEHIGERSVAARVRPESEESNRFVVEVRISFLLTQSNAAFEHVAVHEVCHITLGHVGVFISPPRDKEAEAERCVYEQVGEERYVDFLIAQNDHSFGGSNMVDREHIRRAVQRFFTKKE